MNSESILVNSFLNAAMREAGVPLVRYQAPSSYTADQIRQTIEQFNKKEPAESTSFNLKLCG